MSLIKASADVLRVDGWSVLFRRIINYFLARLRFSVSRKKYSELLSRWGKIQSSSGGRVFIIGNGPSLNITPMYLFASEDTFCFNRFNLMFDKLSWRPTYYMVTDDLVLKDMRDEFSDIIPQVDKAFFPLVHPSNVDANKMINDRENIFWLDVLSPGFHFSPPKCGINKTVANAAIQVSYFLGYRKICFVGVDVNYTSQKVVKKDSRSWTAEDDDDPNHFDKRYFGAGRSYHNPSTDEMIDKFKEAKHIFSNRGVEFFNCGVGGKLEVFPRVSIQEMLGLSDDQVVDRFFEAYNIGDDGRLRTALKDRKFVGAVSGYLVVRDIVTPEGYHARKAVSALYGPCLGAFLVEASA